MSTAAYLRWSEFGFLVTVAVWLVVLVVLTAQYYRDRQPAFPIAPRARVQAAAAMARAHVHGELSKLEPVNLELTGEHVADLCPACGKVFYRPGW